MECANTLFFPPKKTFSFERLIYFFSLTISVLSAIYLAVISVTGYSLLPFLNIDYTSSDLTLSLIQCALGAAALHLPKLASKLFQIQIPDTLSICFYIFVLCGTVLGEMFSLYYAIPVWDSLLHLGSGIMAGMLGSILVVQLLQSKGYERLLSPASVAIAAVCFALCTGVIWEIYEFAGDTLLGLNMQKCLLRDGTELVGKAAVADTMKDLIVDAIGAVIAAACSAFSLKKKSEWIFLCKTVETSQHTVQTALSNEALTYTA